MSLQQIANFNFSLGNDHVIWSLAYLPGTGLRYRPSQEDDEAGKPMTYFFFDSELLEHEAAELLSLIAKLPPNFSQPGLGQHPADGERHFEGRDCLSFRYGTAISFYMDSTRLISPVFTELIQLMEQIRSRVRAEMAKAAKP